MRTLPRLFVFVCCGLMSAAAGAQTSDASVQRQAIFNYELTLPKANHLIEAMVAMTRYVVSLPDYADRMKRAAKWTRAERLAVVENDPKAW